MRQRFLASLTPAERAWLSKCWLLWARPSQLPPQGDWRIWLLLAGRGFGKTRAGAEWVRWLVESGRGRHIALVGETLDDVRHVMVEGASGVLAVASPQQRPRRHALISMAFNLGGPRLASFVQLRAALAAGDFDRAADCALDSRWAVQTGRRALEIARLLRSGVGGVAAPGAGA